MSIRSILSILSIPALVAGCICMAAAAEEPATPAKPTTSVVPASAEHVAALIRKLSHNDYALRESATLELIAIGEPALPALEKARQSADPETAWRADSAARLIRWRITPELWARIGDLMEEYESAPPHVRERIVRILRTSGGDAAIPALRQIIRKESADEVKQAAALMLADLGSKGLAVLVEEGVQIAGLDPYDAAVHVLLGNSFLSDKNYRKAEEHYLKALEIEPEEYIAMYNLACIFSLQKKIDRAIEWLQKAVDAGYDDFGWMEKDTDLDNLRDDPRYKEMVRRGPKAKPGQGQPEEPEQDAPGEEPVIEE